MKFIYIAIAVAIVLQIIQIPFAYSKPFVGPDGVVPIGSASIYGIFLLGYPLTQTTSIFNMGYFLIVFAINFAWIYLLFLGFQKGRHKK